MEISPLCICYIYIYIYIHTHTHTQYFIFVVSKFIDFINIQNTVFHITFNFCIVVEKAGQGLAGASFQRNMWFHSYQQCGKCKHAEKTVTCWCHSGEQLAHGLIHTSLKH